MSPAKQSLFGWTVIIGTILLIVYSVYRYDHRTLVLAELSLNSRQRIRVVEDAPHGWLFDDTFIYRAEFYHDEVLASADSVSHASFSAKEASIEPNDENTIVKLDGTPTFSFLYGRMLGSWRILSADSP